MEQRRVGGTGLTVSRVGLGTMTWGRDTDEHEAREQLLAFLEAGGTLLDTAAAYGDGASEALLGRLLGEVADRRDVVVTTKAGIRRRDDQRQVDLSRRGLLDDLDASLVRLGTDHVDLWLAHTWSWATPVDETLAALEHAVTSGRARYVGVSNYTGWETAYAAATLSGRAARVPLAATQVEYSLLERGVEREVLPAATALGVGVLAWSPLGRGVLTGKYRNGIPADSRAASPHFASFVQPYLGPEGTRVAQAVATAADGLGLSPTEVALAWVRDRPGVAAAVVGARTAGQLRGSLATEQVVLPDEIRQALDEVSTPQHGYPEAGYDQRRES